MEQIKSRLAVILTAAFLAGCGSTAVYVPPKPEDLPKPIINPYLLKPAPETLSDLPDQFSWDDVLTAHGADVVRYDSARCKLDALQQIVCKAFGLQCSPPETSCSKLLAPSIDSSTSK